MRFRSRTRSWFLAQAAFSFGFVPLAEANVVSQLDYFRDEEAKHCPSEVELRKAVETRLGYEPFVDWSPRRVVVDIGLVNPRELRASIRLVQGGGIVNHQSEVTAPTEDCEELIASVALAIAITLDPVKAAGIVGETAPKPAEPTVIAPEQPPQPEQRTTRVVQPKRHVQKGIREERAGLFGTFGTMVTFGTEPNWSTGVHAGLGASYSRFVGVTEFRADVSRTQDSPMGAARVGFLGASIAPCATWHRVEGCAEILLGALVSKGEVHYSRGREASFHAALGPKLQVPAKLTQRTQLVTGVALLRTLAPTTLRLERREVWSTPDYSVTVTLGLRANFP